MSGRTQDKGIGVVLRLSQVKVGDSHRRSPYEFEGSVVSRGMDFYFLGPIISIFISTVPSEGALVYSNAQRACLPLPVGAIGMCRW